VANICENNSLIIKQILIQGFEILNNYYFRRMKEYQDVVTDRFNNNEEDLNDSIYSPNHPIGKYSRKYLFTGLSVFVDWFINKQGSLKDKKVLDVGCGSGEILSFFAARGFLPENLQGIDLSDTRIQRALKQYPNFNFKCGDALNFHLDDEKFDLITSFDLFSHMKFEQEIITGLKNVNHHLQEDGLFLWYDIFSKDHYSAPENSDSWGFNKRQMINLAQKAGFELVYYRPFFKLFFNKYHSVYQVKRFPPIMVRIMEKILPGSPGNMLMILRKNKY